jgi:hypothetical protein
MRERRGSPRLSAGQADCPSTKESRMKHYESYVSESQARRRRQLALGLVGAVMLATLAMAALAALGPTALA